MSVNCFFLLLSGRCLCLGLITRPKESYECDVPECGLETSTVWRPIPISHEYQNFHNIVTFL
jgi:hypothetical protein